MALSLDFLKQLKKLKLLTRRRVVSSFAGGRASTRLGRGLESADKRQYFPGDDIRFIDWKVYGRTERLFIKQFEEDKSLTTQILIDCSNSMDFKTVEHTKFEYASMLAAGFMYLITNENEKFGLMTYSTKIKDILKANRGKKQLLKAISVINEQNVSGKTDIGKVANEYAKSIKTKSLVILISDFLEPVENIQNAIYRISKKTRNFIVVHVADPIEFDLNYKGETRFFDLETEESKKVYVSPDFQMRYSLRFMQHVNRIKRICKAVNADFYSINTKTPIFDSIFDIAHLQGLKVHH